MNLRTVDLKVTLEKLAAAFPTLAEVHLFGSRLYRTGSARSDIDLLVEFADPAPSTGELSNWIADNEPYVDLFVQRGDAAMSAANGSQIVGQPGLLIDELGASCVWRKGSWIDDGHKSHRVIDSWAPIATIAAPGGAPFKPIDVPPPCDVLIVSALPKEHDAVRRQLPSPRTWTPAGDIAPSFEVSLLQTAKGRERHIASAIFPRMGMAPAAVTTKGLVDFLSPQLVMLVGIAGGISPEDVSLGDLVIPEAIFDYEAVKVTHKGEEPNGMIAPISPAPYQLIKQQDWSRWTKNVGRTRPGHGLLSSALGRMRGRPMKELRIHFDGPMASGHKVIADAERGQALRAVHRKTTSIDMESWGVAEACISSRHPTPFVVIKAISDYADEQKNDGWHEFCCRAAATFAVELLTKDLA
jgi:nucleoside phosphorylase/predicted nucleotidyltransferase